MKRPGPTGLMLLLAFAVLVAIEGKTVLAFVGVDVASRVYYPTVVLLMAIAFAALMLMPSDEGNPSRA